MSINTLLDDPTMINFGRLLSGDYPIPIVPATTATDTTRTTRRKTAWPRLPRGQPAARRRDRAAVLTRGAPRLFDDWGHRHRFRQGQFHGALGAQIAVADRLVHIVNSRTAYSNPNLPAWPGRRRKMNIPYLLTCARDWQRIKRAYALDHAGTADGNQALMDSRRIGELADAVPAPRFCSSRYDPRPLRGRR